MNKLLDYTYYNKVCHIFKKLITVPRTGLPAYIFLQRGRNLRVCTPSRARTYNPRLRRAMLYPIELSGQFWVEKLVHFDGWS